MVWRTESATSVEIATILFSITIAPFASRAGRSNFVHLTVIVCAVLSGFRLQTIKNRQPHALRVTIHTLARRRGLGPLDFLTLRESRGFLGGLATIRSFAARPAG